MLSIPAYFKYHEKPVVSGWLQREVLFIAALIQSDKRTIATKHYLEGALLIMHPLVQFPFKLPNYRVFISGLRASEKVHMQGRECGR